jgi:GT2 family glycosyltransferase
VVTVTRNDLDRLLHTWQSLLDQDSADFEWIVVDGASTDGTVDWLQALEDARLTFVSEPDDGIYDAMNKGLGLATGVLVTFLNAGDCYLRPGVLADVVSSHQDAGWVWGHGAGTVVDASGRPVRPVTSGYRGRLRYAFGRSVVIHQTVFAEAAVVRRLGGFDVRFPIAADVHLTMRLGQIGDPTVWTSVDVAYEEGGVSDQSAARSLGDMHRARVDVFGMGPVAARADSVWTAGVVAYVRSRRAAKAVAQRVLGRGSVDWWARR